MAPLDHRDNILSSLHVLLLRLVLLRHNRVVQGVHPLIRPCVNFEIADTEYLAFFLPSRGDIRRYVTCAPGHKGAQPVCARRLLSTIELDCGTGLRFILVLLRNDLSVRLESDVPENNIRRVVKGSIAVFTEQLLC